MNKHQEEITRPLTMILIIGLFFLLMNAISGGTSYQHSRLRNVSLSANNPVYQETADLSETPKQLTIHQGLSTGVASFVASLFSQNHRLLVINQLILQQSNSLFKHRIIFETLLPYGYHCYFRHSFSEDPPILS